MARRSTAKKSADAQRPLEEFFERIEREGTDTSKFSIADATRLVREDRDAGHWGDVVLVVADASVLVVALQRLDAEGDRLRRWLSGLSGGRELQLLQNLTQLEVMSALRRLVLTGALAQEEAALAIVRFMELPARRLQVTQPMAIRIWELRDNLTAYDAAYVALAERLQAEERREVVLATADSRLANAPRLTIDVRLFPE